MKKIDLRSDTVFRPTLEMKKAILHSPYGNYDYGQDPTTIELQTYAINLFKAQGAAYTPSATFANQCALLTSCKQPGGEMIVREQSHIGNIENGASGRIARLMTRLIDLPFGYITPDILKKYIRKKKDSQSPKTSTLVLQYPTFEGQIPPMSIMQQCYKMAKEDNIHVHIDGARLFNGLAESKVEPHELMKCCDSLTICLSKGLLASVGSMVIGGKEFMTQFKKNQNMMGGTFQKPGVLTGQALVGLKTM